MMKPKILALTGPKGSGKTTFSSLLRQHNPILKRAPIYPFAGPLKGMLQFILPPEAFLTENKEDPAYGLCGRSPRYLMQTLGTEWGRKTVGDEIWIEAVRRQIKTSPSDYILIDDLRFENEAEMVLDLGGKIYLVERPGFKWDDSGHPSERGIDCFYIDGVIPNRSQNDLLKFSKIFNPFDL